MESLLGAARQFKAHTDDKETDRQTQRDSVTETERQITNILKDSRQANHQATNSHMDLQIYLKQKTAEDIS